MEVILPNNSKYIIGSVYRPGSTHPTLTPLELFNEFSDLFSTLLDTLSNLPNLLIFGDLNIDVLQFGSNVRATDFVEHIFSYGLLQLVTKPTRCNDNSATLIDHIISKVNLPFFDISIITSRISDHFPVILSLSCNIKSTVANKTISKRSFSKTNIDKFKEALNNINWNVVRDAESTQLSYNIFSDIFTNFYELYFPVRDIKFNKKFHKIEPWFTKGLELPTRVYANAAEAINLKAFSEEIQPFVKEIFIDKYPHVVSLHSLDAGNLSLTLGYTQLRLREGDSTVPF